MRNILRRTVPVAVATALVVFTGIMTIRPTASDAETHALAKDLAFVTKPLNSAPANPRVQRVVAPELEKIRAWISAVGAAVGLMDLRGLNRPADACLVDPRDDTVTVLPVPEGGGPQYGRFVLHPAGLPYDATMAPMGCVPGDVNEDGTVDITVYYWGRSPIVFLNTGPPGAVPGHAAFRPVELVSPMEIWNSTALNIADIDGDGHIDIIVGNYFPDRARVLDPAAKADARTQMQDSMGRALNAGINRLFLLTPTGRAGEPPQVADRSAAIPADCAQSWTLAFGFQDLKGNGRPDLYVANDFGPDQLLINTSAPGTVRLESRRGVRDLTTPRSEVLGYDSFKGMGVVFQYNENPDMPTIMVSNITTPYALHESNFAFVPTGSGKEILDGGLPFDERSEELGVARSGWAWDIKAGDFDNSGSSEVMQATGFLKGHVDRWPELQELAMANDQLLMYPGAWPNFQVGDDLSGHQHNPLWTRNGDGRYHDVAQAAGAGATDVTRGFAFGDVNGDGKLDALVANQWEDSKLLLNTSPSTATAADIALVQPAAGGTIRAAIGAEIVVHTPSGPEKQQLYPANGHAGVSGAELHLPLRGAAHATATVSWTSRSGRHQTTVGITPGHHQIVLGDDGTAVTR